MSISNETILKASGRLPTKVSTLCAVLSGPCQLQEVKPDLILSSIVVADNDPIESGCLFVPYNESDDACRKMVQKGASCVLTDHGIEGLPCIVVPNVVEALYSICEWMFDQIRLPSVVVAGSEGKTTTKRMIKCVLETQCKVFCQTGNYNTFQALCCSLQHVEKGAEVIVQEVDEKRIRNTRNCSMILQPKIAVVTNIAEAHIGFYGSKEALIGSFEGISAGMPEDGLVIVNGDDRDSLRAEFGRKLITVGIQNEGCDYLARNITANATGTAYDLYYRGEKLAAIKLRVCGTHNVYNSMMAFAVGHNRGLSVESIRKGLAAFRNSGIRQNLCKLGKTLVYADCYNASATSIRFAINCFDELTLGKKAALILGDIAEIEGHEKETYRQIAAYVDASHAAAICTYGKDSGAILRYLKRPMETREAKDLKTLLEQLQSLKREGYTGFLFKASRFMKLEQAIKAAFPLHYKAIQLEDMLAK